MYAVEWLQPLCNRQVLEVSNIKSDHDDMNTALGIIPVLHHGCAPRWFCERIRAQRVNTLLVAVFFPPLFYFFPGLEDRVLSKCSDAHIYLDHGTCSMFQRWQSAFVSQIILGTYCNASSPEPWENVVNHGPRVNTSELSPSRPLCSLCPRASRPLSLRRLVCRHSAWWKRTPRQCGSSGGSCSCTRTLAMVDASETGSGSLLSNEKRSASESPLTLSFQSSWLFFLKFRYNRHNWPTYEVSFVGGRARHWWDTHRCPRHVHGPECRPSSVGEGLSKWHAAGVRVHWTPTRLYWVSSAGAMEPRPVLWRWARACRSHLVDHRRAAASWRPAYRRIATGPVSEENGKWPVEVCGTGVSLVHWPVAERKWCTSGW